MSQDIVISANTIRHAINGLQHAATGTDPTTADVAAVTSEAPTLIRYEAALRTTSNLLQQYLTLVKKDSSTLHRVHQTFTETDQAAAKQINDNQ